MMRLPWSKIKSWLVIMGKQLLKSQEKRLVSHQDVRNNTLSSVAKVSELPTEVYQDLPLFGAVTTTWHN